MRPSAPAVVMALVATVGLVVSIAAVFLLERVPALQGLHGPVALLAVPYVLVFGLWGILNAVRARKSAQSVAAKVAVLLPVVLFASFCLLVAAAILRGSEFF